MPSLLAVPNRFTSQLTPTLGFGWLDHQSISLSTKELYAEYHIDRAVGKDVVYSAWLDGDICRLEEFFEGRRLAVCQKSTLMQAFFHLGTISHPLEHPRLRQMIARITASWNILAYLPLNAGYIFFPSGLLFSLHVPVTTANCQAWESLKDQEARAGELGRLHYSSQQNRLIVPARVPLKKISPPLETIVLSALLTELESLCRLLAESEIILPDEEHPVLITLCHIQPTRGKPIHDPREAQ